MKMGEYINYLRTGGNKNGNKWTQEELGKALNPPINRAAINKWESGQVENIKRSYIEQMAKLFQVKPSDLMCFIWDEKYNKNDKLAKEVHLCELIEQTYGKATLELVNDFQMLDEVDKAKITERMAMLLEDEKYSFKKELLNA
ncbi:MAG: helix-turn-helix transcriptional regulator [Peptostreptococcaceae bacterium]|nr:helix-turn-helix transcriptional regulator [Peptostreptococcaceae bacterium]